MVNGWCCMHRGDLCLKYLIHTAQDGDHSILITTKRPIRLRWNSTVRPFQTKFIFLLTKTKCKRYEQSLRTAGSLMMASCIDMAPPPLSEAYFLFVHSIFFRFLADRFVEGTCPFCAYEVRFKVIAEWDESRMDLNVLTFLGVTSSNPIALPILLLQVAQIEFLCRLQASMLFFEF